MIRTLFLHIGFHKTASTAIQDTFHKNRKLLESVGYLYPDFRVGTRIITNHSEVFYSMFCAEPEKYHMNLVKNYNTPEKIEALHADYHRQFQQQIRSFSGNNLVISGEGISLLEEDQLNAFKNYLIQNTHPAIRIRVIAFVRHPVDWTVSKIQEVVKGGNSIHKAVERNLKNQKPFFKLLSLKYKKCFSEHDVELYRFEDAVKHQNGITGQFLTILGVRTNAARQILNEFANVSLSHEATVLLSGIFEKMPLYIGNRKNPDLNDFNREYIFEVPGQKFSVSPEVKSKIWAGAQADVAWLHETMNFPKYRYVNQKQDDNQKWNEEVIRFLDTAFLSRFSDPVTVLILNEILLEIRRYRKVFDMDKKIALFAFWEKNSGCYRFKSKNEKNTCIKKHMGRVNTAKIRLAIFMRTKFPAFYP